MERKYEYNAPKYFQGENVQFQPHNPKHSTLVGTIQRVETHYSKDKAYHVYSISRNNRDRHIHVGENSINFKMK